MSICLMLVSSTPHFSELSTNIFQVDENRQPTIYDTLLFRIPKFAYAKSVGRLLGKKPSEDALEVEEDESADENSALKMQRQLILMERLGSGNQNSGAVKE